MSKTNGEIFSRFMYEAYGNPQKIFIGMGTPRGLVFDIGQARELAQELNILADVLEAEVSQPSGLLVQDL